MKSMVTWWAFTDDEQPLLSLENAFEIEHIYAKNRYEKEGSLTDPANLESLGNKALLEKRINIRASDYRFVDKKKYYEGYTNAKGQFKEGTKNKELREIADSKKDFTEADIIERHDAMINGFMKYLEQYDLLK
ncbi:MAG: HNH endonuclease family protein [Eubacterium sp.]|nr:HNH endonuclease family protein [Eubacterium sp.]MCH4045846.1 HNH endonuclease family protein [Eubacterium sp.]MCH4078937.1 HNH endonuclease family protein [Eubacterium sp.]